LPLGGRAAERILGADALEPKEERSSFFHAHTGRAAPLDEGGEMKRTRLGLKGFAVAGALALVIASAHGQEKKTPDGTVEFTGGSVAAGLGFSWGSGTLTYKGKKYPFTVSGLSAGAAGAASVTASGSVYNLKKVEDFEGNYTGVGTGATVGGGASVTTMRNQNGVVIDSVSTTRGLAISLATGGMKIKLQE
jgi:hypothetical protein